MPDKILIVDDSVENRQLLFRTLAKAGYEIVEAGDGREGLTRALDLLPELILLDIVMPELDGYQVCEALKKDLRTANIPVIFLSAKSETKDKIKGLEIGGMDYITNPLNRFNKFFTIVYLLLDISQQRIIYSSAAHPPTAPVASGRWFGVAEQRGNHHRLERRGAVRTRGEAAPTGG